ncbi:hypothetical protein JCM17960_10890 [Magnetospira thiophila]
MDGKSIPPVRIAEIDGQVYTLDHRRVVAYREAGKPIPYRKATAEEVREALGKQDKMTTRNEGMEIRIRGVK